MGGCLEWQDDLDWMGFACILPTLTSIMAIFFLIYLSYLFFYANRLALFSGRMLLEVTKLVALFCKVYFIL